MARAGDGVAELVEQREDGDEARQPDPERGAVGEDHDDHEQVETGADVHGEPEQPERRL